MNKGSLLNVGWDKTTVCCRFRLFKVAFLFPFGFGGGRGLLGLTKHIGLGGAKVRIARGGACSTHLWSLFFYSVQLLAV